MKKLLVVIFTMMIVFTLTACGNVNNEESHPDESETNPDHDQGSASREKNDKSSQKAAENNDESDSSEEKIVVTLDNGEIIINVYDNPTSMEFLEQLPLTLTFEEFGGFEKLSYPPEKLTTEGAPDGYIPERGDFSYFAPWGDITLFYGDHRYSKGLIKLGEIESGVDLLDDINEDFEAAIERMD